MSSAVRLIWKCHKPSSQSMVQQCESLMTRAALAYGMDTAVIRKEVHDTTKINGHYVKTFPHVTGDIIDTKNQKGYALHYNLDAGGVQPLDNLPPAAPNPQVWELKFKAGKGFILADDETETVRDID